MKILIASNNKHKIEEINRILNEHFPGQFELISPSELGLELEVDETADTLEGNAELKARAFHEATGMPVIADDTGLEIDALGGKPGVFSARFAGEPPDDAKNRLKVLELLQAVPEKDRKARFRTVICYFDKTKPVFIEGRCEGQIINEERGKSGFGYDPVFKPAGFDKTFAEMSASEKNAISHRGRAVMNFVNWLKNNLQEL
jgi:XTP/dITP diphosphohydrolase